MARPAVVVVRRASALLTPIVAAVLLALAACSQAPMTPAPPVSDPAAWISADVGNVQVKGSLQESGGELHVLGAGANIWDDADSFHYVYQSFDGDVDVRAHIKDLQRTDGWAKAGVMVRETLDAGSIHAFMDITPDGVAEFIWRASTGGGSQSSLRYNVGLPTWVRVVRSGSTLTGYVSADGQSWSQIGSVDLGMNATAYVGLAVTSLNPTVLAQAVVENLSATDPSGTPTTSPPPPTGGATGAWVCPSQPLSPAYQPTLYVSPSGDDGNDGRSPSTPLRTLRQAAAMVQPGDVVWLRGGVYSANVEFRTSGTASAPIVVESYPGECAVLDGSGLGSIQRLTLNNVSHYVVRNLTVRNSAGEGILVTGSDHNTLSNLLVYGSYYSGITNLDSSGNIYQYIVSHDNFDAPNGGDADGISISSGDGNRVSHCVVYNNSDDGIDTWKSTNTVIERCVSTHNGFQGGDGNGFKAGGAGTPGHTIVRQSLAYDNAANGFDYNTSPDVQFDNNTAYGNRRTGFVAAGGTLRNNLSLSNGAGAMAGSGNVEITNSWNLAISAASFLSNDPTQPDFLGLGSGSLAIGSGTDIGLPFAGAAPDLGALPHGEAIEDVVGVSLSEAMGY